MNQENIKNAKILDLHDISSNHNVNLPISLNILHILLTYLSS